jgi:hypothetical protein
LGISIEHIFHVSARKFIEFLVPSKDNDGDFRPTQHRKFKSLLEQSILALEERHLQSADAAITRYSSVAIVFDWTDFDLFPAHGVCRGIVLLGMKIRL